MNRREQHAQQSRHAPLPRAGLEQEAGQPGQQSRSAPRTNGDEPEWSQRCFSAPRLPRALRGSTGSGCRDIQAVAPHGRGCPRLLPRPRRRRPVCPALAGMSPQCMPPRTIRQSLPRTRGDVPRRDDLRTRPRASAPHARGCPLNFRACESSAPVCPARAGMSRCSGRYRTTGPSLPRTRGDVPGTRILRRSHLPSAPHARGCPLAFRDQRERGRRPPCKRGVEPTDPLHRVTL